MAIVRRKSPEQQLSNRMGDHWRSILNYPMIAALCNPSHVSHVDVSPSSILSMVSSMYDRSWFSSVDWNSKIFLYASGLVARRAEVSGFLPEDKMKELSKHMNALTTIDKIEKGDVCGLAFRMCFVFDIPAFRAKYPKNGSLHLPNPISFKPERKKLKKHRKKA